VSHSIRFEINNLHRQRTFHYDMVKSLTNYSAKIKNNTFASISALAKFELCTDYFYRWLCQSGNSQ